MQNQIIETINSGGIVVMPTDTIYGMLAAAFKPEAVKRLYDLRRRDPLKPFIILIGSLADLEKFNIVPTPAQREKLGEFWPGPTSVILGTTAFRLPALSALRDIIAKTGPLVAPSANPAGEPPATSIAEAKKYFGEEGGRIDLYVDGGKIESRPSKLIRLDLDGKVTVERA